MNFEEAVKQLEIWCRSSKGKLIEISPDNFLSFESLETYDDLQINSIEESLQWKLPDTYKIFLKAIGKSRLFLNANRLGTVFFDPGEVLHASEIQVWESWEEEKKESPHRFCIVGKESGLGDFFGFAIGIESSKNFDVFCHEYPPFEYVEVSDEIKSWKSFDEWIVQIVENFGQERL